MGIGEYLTLRFFWEVRDEGSWLEIGESISMFVIASLLCIFVAGLEGVSELFVRGVGFADDERVKKDEKRELTYGHAEPAAVAGEKSGGSLSSDNDEQ